MAISYVASSYALGTGAYPPNPVTLGASAGVGNAIVALVAFTSASPGAYGLTGSLNGAYTLLAAYNDTVNAVNLAWFYVKVTTAGADVVSPSGSPADFGYIQLAAFSGIPGTITQDNTATGTASAALVTSYSLACSSGHGNEVLLGTVLPSTGSVNLPTGWTALGTPVGGSANMFYAIQASAGSLPLSGTLGSTANYDALTSGIYGLAAAGGGSNLLLLGA